MKADNKDLPGNRRIIKMQRGLHRGAIATGVLQERLRKFEVKEVDRLIVKKMLPELIRDIDRATDKGRSTWDSRRKVEMTKRLSATYSRNLGAFREQVNGAMERAADLEVKRAGQVKREVLPDEIRAKGFGLGTATADEIKSRMAEAKIGEQPIADAIDYSFSGLAERHANRADDIIKTAYAEGVNPRDAAAKCVRELGPEVAGMTKRRAETMTRTAMLSAANEARDAQITADAELYKAVQWVATLDDRTTQTCGALDGKFFPLDSGKRPPAHWNCRSLVIPILKSLYEMGLSDDPNESEGGDARLERETYEEWLKAQPEEVQDSILGQEKAELFRTGEIKLEDTVDRFGSPLSLKEIKDGKGGGFLKEAEASAEPAAVEAAPLTEGQGKLAERLAKDGGTLPGPEDAKGAAPAATGIDSVIEAARVEVEAAVKANDEAFNLAGRVFIKKAEDGSLHDSSAALYYSGLTENEKVGEAISAAQKAAKNAVSNISKLEALAAGEMEAEEGPQFIAAYGSSISELAAKNGPGKRYKMGGKFGKNKEKNTSTSLSALKFFYAHGIDPSVFVREINFSAATTRAYCATDSKRVEMPDNAKNNIITLIHEMMHAAIHGDAEIWDEVKYFLETRSESPRQETDFNAKQIKIGRIADRGAFVDKLTPMAVIAVREKKDFESVLYGAMYATKTYSDELTGISNNELIPRAVEAYYRSPSSLKALDPELYSLVRWTLVKIKERQK